MHPTLVGGFLVIALIGRVTAVEIDPAILNYRPVVVQEGTLNSVGSDTLNNLMTFWVEGFRVHHPAGNVRIEGKGNSTAPVALVDGTAHLGPMSRLMNPKELAAFETRWGYPPTPITVALDALALVVHPDNPVQSLSLTQLDQVFSSTCKRGGTSASVWGDLGLGGEWATKPIALYGRHSASGTYGFMKQRVLMGGDFKPGLNDQSGGGPGIAVARNRDGIGYAGIGYLTKAVRTVPLSDGDQPAVPPTHEHALTGSYPLTRTFYLYLNHQPEVALNPLVAEFVRFVLSKSGQDIVVKDGYFPLSAALVAEQLKKLAP